MITFQTLLKLFLEIKQSRRKHLSFVSYLSGLKFHSMMTLSYEIKNLSIQFTHMK